MIKSEKTSAVAAAGTCRALAPGDAVTTPVKKSFMTRSSVKHRLRLRRTAIGVLSTLTGPAKTTTTGELVVHNQIIGKTPSDITADGNWSGTGTPTGDAKTTTKEAVVHNQIIDELRESRTAIGQEPAHRQGRKTTTKKPLSTIKSLTKLQARSLRRQLVRNRHTDRGCKNHYKRSRRPQ